MDLYTKVFDAVMKLLRFVFCSRKCDQVYRSKAENRPNYPEYRTWIRNVFEIDAWDWDTLEAYSPYMNATYLLEHLNPWFGTTVTFVANNEVKGLLERPYRK